MTKEELEKEIKNYIDENCNQWETDGLTADDIVRIAVLDFAEPREKRIKELEQKLEQTEKDLTDYQFNYPKIKDLEKENAELKKHIKADCIDCADYIKNQKLEKENARLKTELTKKADTNHSLVEQMSDLKQENAELKEKVDKATELIGDMYDKIPASHSDYYKDVLERAEQFLKE